MARPSTYNIELCKEICEKVSSGLNIIDVLKDNDKYPTSSTWFRWKDDHNELWELYVKAVQNKTEFLNSEIDRIFKKCENEEITPSNANVLIQTLKWKMSKFYPKMFGDKVEHDIKSSDRSMSPKTGLENNTYEELYKLKYGKAPE